MPELPDLEVFTTNLNKSLKGTKLDKIKISSSAKLNVGAAVLNKSIRGSKLKKVERRGKELCFVFSNGNELFLHMMLHGKLHWAHEKPEKNTLAEFVFGKKILGLSDFQKAAKITLNPPASEVPDALGKDLNLKTWKEILQSRSSIKNLLLDQKSIRGIGNAYADEILWAARISPLSISQKIPPDKIRTLAASVKKVLKGAIKKIAAKGPGIIGGEVRDFLLIHNAKKKTSPKGAKIKTIDKGRKTYFTDEQKMYR